MSEFEDKLSGLLNDPDQMSKIAAMAKSLMGGGDTDDPEPESATAPVLDGLDPGMLSKVAKLFQKSGSGGNERTALLNAMKPYLSEKRREKMDKAMKLAKLAEIAELAAGEFGGDGDV